MQKTKRRLFGKEKNDDKSDKSLKYVSSIIKADTKSHLLRQLRIADSRCPLNFDEFIPRISLEWGISELVIIKRVLQEDYVAVGQKKLGAIKRSRVKSGIMVDDVKSKQFTSEEKLEQTKTQSSIITNEDAIVIKAYYDSRDKLVNLSITGCPVKIPQKLIRALGLCMPFHSALNHLTIKNGGVSYHTIYEIYRLLPHSNLTNICLDDSYVPEGNYYLLLQEITQLSYLSLNRCKITDDVCEKITHQLMLAQPASNTLQILELASNMISNKGAIFLGKMLRSNRRLLHLNLAGNSLDDSGIETLFSSLMRFHLLEDEIKERKGIKLNYLRNKQTVYDKCLNQLILQRNREMTEYNTSYTNRTNIGKKSLKRSQILSVNSNTSNIPTNLKKKGLKRSPMLSNKYNIYKSNINPILDDLNEYAELFTKSIVGEFIDPFCPISTLKEKHYAEGNLVLCSINLAYNNLHFPSLKKLAEVMEYQHAVEKTTPATGLMRIVLNGNYLPERCDELDKIELLMKLNRLEKLVSGDIKYSISFIPEKSRSVIAKSK